MAEWEVAQLNIAALLAPLDSPQLRGFVAALDRINSLAEQSPGFVWRLQSALDEAAEEQRLFGSNVIVNLSVWKSVESLHAFTYRSAHAEIMSRRRQWFTRSDSAHLVLWWIPAGHRPTAGEARARLEQLDGNGPGPDAFTFRHVYPVDDIGAG